MANTGKIFIGMRNGVQECERCGMPVASADIRAEREADDDACDDDDAHEYNVRLWARVWCTCDSR